MPTKRASSATRKLQQRQHDARLASARLARANPTMTSGQFSAAAGRVRKLGGVVPARFTPSRASGKKINEIIPFIRENYKRNPTKIRFLKRMREENVVPPRYPKVSANPVERGLERVEEAIRRQRRATFDRLRRER